MLTARKINGGLNLSNLKLCDRSIKIQWVQRYFQDPIIQALADALLENTVGQWIWYANLKYNDVCYFTKAKGFWMDVLKAWCHFNYQIVCNRDQVLKQFLWYNSELRKNNKPYISWNLFNAGIHFLHDIVNADYTFKSIVQIKVSYPNIDILEYFSLIQSIRPTWRRWLKYDSNIEMPVPRIQLLDKLSTIVSTAYACMNDATFVSDYKCVKWSNKLNLDISLAQFVKIIKNIWLITNTSKLRSFQYKILMHAIVTNVTLYKWKIPGVSKMCTFCQAEPETDIHLFCECTFVQQIWQVVVEWISKFVGNRVKLNAETIMFNNIVNNPKHVVNVIVLITKFNIYRSRCMGNKPSIVVLVDDIMTYYKMELLGAKIKGKEYSCQEKWHYAINEIDIYP